MIDVMIENLMIIQWKIWRHVSLFSLCRYVTVELHDPDEVLLLNYHLFLSLL